MTVTRRCETCGEPVYEGEALEYEDEAGNGRDDGFDGSCYPGCGVCEVCQKLLCADCGDFDRDGVCAACREAEEDDEDEDL
jgi:hypothetical protein